MTTNAEYLLGLQDLDSAIDACGHRRTRLPERATAGAADAEVKSLEVVIERAATAAGRAEGRIEALEKENAGRDVKKAKLNAQLKTIIAPREAEALMNEIARLDSQRAAADDEELVCMDALEAAEVDRSSADASLITARAAQSAAHSELAAAVAALDVEVADLKARRAEVVVGTDPAMVSRYERLRVQFSGIAIARLVHATCGGCHLDQSRAGIEALKHPKDGEPGECEQCGRLLVP